MTCESCLEKSRLIERLREENRRLAKESAGQASLFALPAATPVHLVGADRPLDPIRGLVESRQRRDEVIDRFASKAEIAAKRGFALALANEIASAAPDGTVRVWEIQKLFHERLGLTQCTWTDHVAGCAWLTSSGTSYWAGSIFATRAARDEWECVGAGCSPANNNDSNKVWRRRSPWLRPAVAAGREASR